MPPLHDFADCSGTHMDGAPRLADSFPLSLAQLFFFFWLKIGPTVTRSRDLVSSHVIPKIAHIRDLCTKHMEMSFFLKIDQTLVIGSC